MNSTIFDDLSREDLASETTQNLKNIHVNTQNITALHKELLEINLSITVYIEESKRRLKELRLELAHQATSSQRVVEILSDKYDITLEWFGRTIKTRKKVSSFVNNDIQCSRHDFTTVECIDKIELRNEKIPRINDSNLTSPLLSPEEGTCNRLKLGKRKLQSTCLSPQWAEGYGPGEESEPTEKKKKLQHNHTHNITNDNNISMEIGNKGDGIDKLKNTNATPPNIECGQGDCQPSTSGTKSGNSYETLTTELPKLAVECNGYIKFTRTRNSYSDSMKWERKCKVQISYSEDPFNVGEYVIWALQYSDENKCRRNLLSAFEEVSD